MWTLFEMQRNRIPQESPALPGGVLEKYSKSMPADLRCKPQALEVWRQLLENITDVLVNSRIPWDDDRQVDIGVGNVGGVPDTPKEFNLASTTWEGKLEHAQNELLAMVRSG